MDDYYYVNTFSQWINYMLSFHNEFMWWFCWVVIILFVVFLAWIAGTIHTDILDSRDEKSGYGEPHTGVILRKEYESERHYSGSTTTVIPTTSGGVGIGVGSTSSTSPEQYLFFIRDNGQIVKMEVDAEDFFAHNEGDTINFFIWRGGKTGKHFYPYLHHKNDE